MDEGRIEGEVVDIYCYCGGRMIEAIFSAVNKAFFFTSIFVL